MACEFPYDMVCPCGDCDFAIPLGETRLQPFTRRKDGKPEEPFKNWNKKYESHFNRRHRGELKDGDVMYRTKALIEDQEGGYGFKDVCKEVNMDEPGYTSVPAWLEEYNR